MVNRRTQQLAALSISTFLLIAEARGQPSASEGIPITPGKLTHGSEPTESGVPTILQPDDRHDGNPVNSGSENTKARQDATEQTAGDTAGTGQDSAISELSRLQSLEERLFNMTWPLDGTDERLLRLEKFALGAEGKGDTKKRLEKLDRVLSARLEAAPGKASPGAQTTADSGKPKGLLAIINNGIDNYNKHRFHNAEDDFNDALAIAPGMSRIHVYLGATLLQLNQRKSAIDAMQAAYELDPFGQYGRYAKNCLLTLMGDEEVRKRGPKDNLKTVQKTLDTVNRQTDADMQRHNASGSKLSIARTISINNQSNRISQDADNWSNEIALRQNFVRMDGMVQSARIRQDAAQRAAFAQESANNLKSLMTAKLLPGDAKLRAFGTTLNARYYGDETYNLAPWYIPREAPLELKAQAALLPSLRSRSPFTAGSLKKTSKASKGKFSQAAKKSTGKPSAKRSPISLKSQSRKSKPSAAKNRSKVSHK